MVAAVAISSYTGAPPGVTKMTSHYDLQSGGAGKRTAPEWSLRQTCGARALAHRFQGYAWHPAGMRELGSEGAPGEPALPVELAAPAAPCHAWTFSA